MKNRYAMLTVDVEALPKRAIDDHVRRLIWGEHAIYSEVTNQPFCWSNGVVEVLVTERRFSVPFGNSWWGRLQFPVTHGGRNPPWRVLSPYTWFSDSSFMVLLLHSWSLLYWDEQGLAEYRDDQRLKDYRRLVRKMSKDYDIIDTADFLELQAQGKIRPSRTVDLGLAEWQAPSPKEPVRKQKSSRAGAAKGLT